MELAPAPVNFSEGVLVSQSPPRTPPGADDEQEPVGLAFVDVVLEEEQAPARRPAVQAIARRRSLNCSLWALCVNCCSSRRGWALTGPSGSRRHGEDRQSPARRTAACRGSHIIRAVDIVEIL